MDIISKALTGCFESVLPHLDERQRRLNVGTVAVMLGRGGRTKMSELTGRSRSTVIQGASEIEAGVVGGTGPALLGGWCLSRSVETRDRSSCRVESHLCWLRVVPSG
ncbi:MAG TPA: hypothetical protein DCQ04_03640 [Actinobacteria bacterium]|nr:hypothetical protein [Actinomycetota bacterium]